MGGEVDGIDSMPLLPAGTSLFTTLPARAIVLAALASAIEEGVVTLVDGNRTGVLVIRAGSVADALSVDGGRTTGEAALQAMAAWETALMSASRLDNEAMSLLDALINGERCYEDLRLEWTRWPELIDDLRARGGTYVVEVRTVAGRGVTIIRSGQQVATYTDAHPLLGSPELLDGLTGGAGSIRVTVAADEAAGITAVPTVGTARRDDDAERGQAAGHADDAALGHAGGHSDDWVLGHALGHFDDAVLGRAAKPFDDAVQPDGATVKAVASRSAEIHVGGPLFGTAPPAIVPDQNDGNATLTALFGDSLSAQTFAPLVVLDRLAAVTTPSVESLLPALKHLVQQRMQRSAGPVEAVIDAAADGGESVAWLADRVRVMTVRGFMSSTFEQLAEDMLALSLD
jgi:hypothetical protein